MTNLYQSFGNKAVTWKIVVLPFSGGKGYVAMVRSVRYVLSQTSLGWVVQILMCCVEKQQLVWMKCQNNCNWSALLNSLYRVFRVCVCVCVGVQLLVLITEALQAEIFSTLWHHFPDKIKKKKKPQRRNENYASASSMYYTNN